MHVCALYSQHRDLHMVCDVTPYSILQARLYEVVYELYQIIIPVHVAKRQFQELKIIHGKLEDCFQKIVYRVRIHNLYLVIFFNLVTGR